MPLWQREEAQALLRFRTRALSDTMGVMERPKRRRGRVRDLAPGDGPGTLDEEWEECGGEVMWVVGHTEGGAPYGLTASEIRQANEREAGGAG